jgi:prepilin-type N-terminal cleavage/methylation domain-containing protein
MSVRNNSHRGFSLIELVIVVVIIAIIAAIAIPRMSRGAQGATDSALQADLRTLRNAVDLYAQEHGGSYPTVANINATPGALTAYSDDQGGLSATKTGNYIYGPYLRAIPGIPLGTEKGAGTFGASAAASVGWVYDATTGAVTANTGTLTDAKGKAYTSY